MPDRFSGDHATQTPGQRSSAKEPMDRRKATDGVREQDETQPKAASASTQSVSSHEAKAREGKRAQRASDRTPTPRQSALAKLEVALANLGKPWTVLRERETGSNGRALGVAFVGLHPEKGIALIDVEPARPSHAAAGLRVALIRAQNAGFTVREPPIAPVVLSRGEIPNFMARIDEAFAEMPRCAIRNRDWPELAVASLTAEHAQLVLLGRQPKASPSVPAPSKPEVAKRTAPSPVAPQQDVPQRGDDAGTALKEAGFSAAAPRRDSAPRDEARHANGSSAYPPLLRRPNIEPPRIDSAQLDMSGMMRNLKPRRLDAQSRREQSRPIAQEQPDPSPPDIRDAASDEPVPSAPTAQVIAMDRMFDPAWNPSYPPPSSRRGRGWAVAGALCAMLAVLVVLPPQAIGPASSIRSRAEAPAQHADNQGETAAQPTPFATGQGAALGERPELREPSAPPDRHAMTAQELPPPKAGTPPAPATADTKPPAAAPTEAVPPVPDKKAASAATAPAGTGAPSKAASADAAKDRENSALTKPVQKKPSSASARPSAAARKSAAKDSRKTKDVQEASRAMASPPPAAPKPAPKDEKKAQDGQETSGAMTYVEGREPRILGTITPPSSADAGNASQATTDARPAPRGPLSPATDFSITPEGVMAPSGVVMPFDRQ
jgi:hypothetical protein